MRLHWNKIVTSVFIVFAVVNAGLAQQATSIDTLDLNQVITSVIQNNPLLKQSSENINNSVLAVKMARSAYLPTAEINGTYSRMDPIPAFDLPDIGHIQMYPDNSMNAALEVRQLLYDFGKTQKSVALQEINEDISELSAEQLKQKLVLASAGIFYSMVYLQTSMAIVNEHISTLKKHIEFIENKQRTGSATQYEILTTKVRLSATETQLSELQSTFEMQLARLNTLMGSNKKTIQLKNDTIDIIESELADSTYLFAFAHREDILIVKARQASADMNYKLAQTQYYPTLGLFGSGGWKNGYLPEVEKLKPNYIVGLTLKVPIFEGNRKNIKRSMAKCTINQLDYELENTTQVAQDEIIESYSQMQLAEKKIDQSRIQLQQAQEAYDHAQVNYKEGVITNLDLIYATDMLSDSKLQLLKNKMDYQYDLLKFKVSLGERIY